MKSSSLAFVFVSLSLLVYKLCEHEDEVSVVTTVALALRIFPDPFLGIQVLFIEWVNIRTSKLMNEQINKGSDQQTDATAHTAELSLFCNDYTWVKSKYRIQLIYPIYLLKLGWGASHQTCIALSWSSISFLILSLGYSGYKGSFQTLSLAFGIKQTGVLHKLPIFVLTSDSDPRSLF